LTFWAVRIPPGFFAKLPNLVFLDIRGGSGRNADFVSGCNGLRFLFINQVRGLTDIRAVVSLPSLEMLVLFGLPQLGQPPSFSQMERLRYLQVGSMKGLAGIEAFLEAPGPTDFTMMKKVGVVPGDALAIAAHPTIERFEWWVEEVPDNLWIPFRRAVNKPKALSSGDWFRANFQA
jgi:hypothetical protein